MTWVKTEFDRRTSGYYNTARLPAARIDRDNRVYLWRRGEDRATATITVKPRKAKPLAQAWLYGRVYE